MDRQILLHFGSIKTDKMSKQVFGESITATAKNHDIKLPDW